MTSSKKNTYTYHCQTGPDVVARIVGGDKYERKMEISCDWYEATLYIDYDGDGKDLVDMVTISEDIYGDTPDDYLITIIGYYSWATDNKMKFGLSCDMNFVGTDELNSLRREYEKADTVVRNLNEAFGDDEFWGWVTDRG